MAQTLGYARFDNFCQGAYKQYITCGNVQWCFCFIQRTYHNQLGVKLFDGNVIASHVPLLDSSQVEKLDELASDFDLNRYVDQEAFFTEVVQRHPDMGVDHVLEYMVNNHDIPIGEVIADIRLSQSCDTARRIHLAVAQVNDHKARKGQPVTVNATNVMEMEMSR